MAHQLVDLPRLAGLRIEAQAGGPAASRRAGPVCAPESRRQGTSEGRLASHTGRRRRRFRQLDRRRRLQAGNQLPRPANSRRTSSSFGVTIRPGPPPNPGGITTSGARAASTISVAGRDHGRQLRVAELLQQPEDVVVERLLPDILPGVEIAAHADGRDSRVQRAGVEGQHSSVAPADHADLGDLPGPPADLRLK